MAAGVNYNNVWAARGIPMDVIKARNEQGEAEDFRIGDSDAWGVDHAVGEEVTNRAPAGCTSEHGRERARRKPYGAQR